MNRIIVESFIIFFSLSFVAFLCATDKVRTEVDGEILAKFNHALASIVITER